MADTFYIESGSGRQITDLSTVDPTKTYYQSGTGTQYSGSSLLPKTPTSSYTPPTPTYTPPTVVSSTQARNEVSNNINNLQTAETQFGPSPYTGVSIVDYLKSVNQPSDIQSRTNLAQKYGVSYNPNAIGEESASQNTNLLSILRGISPSPSTKGMVETANNLAQSGVTDPSKLSSLQQREADAMSALSSARTASDSKDYRNLDYWMQKYTDDRKKYETEIADYLKSVQPLRERALALMKPGEKEAEVGRQLKDIRMEAEQFELQTQKDQLSEFQGQTQGFAAGRAKEIDFNASFARQERALKEKNLLLELGLLQDARTMEGKSIEAQLGFIRDDFDLQQKIQDKLNEQEESLFTKAQSLDTQARNTLTTILGQLEGINPSKMSQETVTKLSQLASQAGLPFDLVKDALQTQYNQQVFDNSLKTAKQKLDEAQEARLRIESDVKPPESTTGANYNTRLNAEVTNLFSGRYGTDGARETAIGILAKEFPSLNVKGEDGLTQIERDIYNRVADDFKVKPDSRMTASTIDPVVMSELVDDIQSGVQLSELYEAYQEISPSLIQSIFYNK